MSEKINRNFVILREWLWEPPPFSSCYFLSYTFSLMTTVFSCRYNWLLLILMSIANYPARAQADFSLGFSYGRNSSTARFPLRPGLVRVRPMAGHEAGLTGSWSWGHWGVQAAARYVQLGDRLRAEFTYAPGSYYEERRRLDYLQVPLLGVYMLRADGQGPHLLAGGYAGRLTGGEYWEKEDGRRADITPVSAGPPGIYIEYHARGLDAGLQAGLGYRYRGLLLQATYSWGLRNRGITDIENTRTLRPDLASYSRAATATIAYLWGTGI